MNNYKGRDKGRGTGRDEGKSQEWASPSLYYITSFFGLWKKISQGRNVAQTLELHQNLWDFLNFTMM